ncbi:MAG: hypothetical protein ACRDT6_16170 [Micromonosporaceae bacterium]
MPREATYRVRAWFGPRLIADQILTPEEAAAYVRVLRERWPYLAITCEPAHHGGAIAA